MTFSFHLPTDPPTDDLYFIVDEDNDLFEDVHRGSGLFIASGLDWLGLDGDDSNVEDSTGSKQRKKKKKTNNQPQHLLSPIFSSSMLSSSPLPLPGSPPLLPDSPPVIRHSPPPRQRGIEGLTVIPPSEIPSFSGYAEDFADDPNFKIYPIDANKEEIQEAPLLSSKHKDYRRFRYYDLIRSKLGVGDALRSEDKGEKGDKVQFNSQIGVHEFGRDDVLRNEGKHSHFFPFSILTGNHKSASPPNKYFTFKQETYTPELRSLLQAAFERYAWQAPAEYRQLQKIMNMAKKQAGVATENVLCAFEGVSSMGKQFLCVINRLQASATRYLVLSDLSPLSASFEDHLYEQQLCECLADCKELQRDIAQFQKVAQQCEEHMATDSRHIATAIRNSLQCSKKIRELFSMIYERHENCWVQLSGNIRVSSAYTRCINFLTEMSPDRIFRFLKHDFTKLHEDLGNTDHLCGLLIEETQKLITECENRLV